MVLHYTCIVLYCIVYNYTLLHSTLYYNYVYIHTLYIHIIIFYCALRYTTALLCRWSQVPQTSGAGLPGRRQVPREGRQAQGSGQEEVRWRFLSFIFVLSVYISVYSTLLLPTTLQYWLMNYIFLVFSVIFCFNISTTNAITTSYYNGYYTNSPTTLL